jgi:hypothetical protein
MQRWTALTLGLLLSGAVLLVVLRVPKLETTVAPTPSAEPSAATEPAETPNEPKRTDSESDAGPERDAFDTLPDGGPVPELPADAPSTVRFGVVLFAYQGAQFAAQDAPSKEEAHAKAAATLATAKEDFAAAVKQGDPGSTADAGSIPRGVLEPAIEYVLFMMKSGAVHEQPLDTPRGYWVLRRNE